MIVQVSDNVHTSQKMIRFQMNPLITNNIIGPSQLNCMNNIPDTIFGSKPIGGDEHFQINWEMSTFSDTSNCF